MSKMSNRSDLAILGGTPIRGTPLPPYNTIGEAERRAVLLRKRLAVNARDEHG